MMERYKCRFCFKSFANGRALGGHMRSHVLSLSSKRERCDAEEEERPSPLGDETVSGELLPSSSAFSSSSSSENEGNGGEFYGLRENPKRRFRVADSEFDVAGVDHGSVLLQDGESETDSSRIKPTRRRSKRNQKLGGLDVDDNDSELDRAKKLKASQLGFRSTVPEPLSSASDTTEEEDLAFCLVMLSRDKWKQQSKSKEVHENDHDEDNGEEEENETEESGHYRSSKNRARGKYKCETCDRVFKSYQALGGHRASHKKINKVRRTEHQWRGTEYEVGNVVAEKKIHECAICLRVFPTGQALGGHKRSHGIISVSQNHVLRIDKEASVKKRRFIDLNLPAPTEDDETSQAEVSVVFDEC